MAVDDFCYQINASQVAAAQARAAADAQRYYNQRGTMSPENDDPDAGARDHGDAVEMVYDEFEGAWVEQRQLPAR